MSDAPLDLREQITRIDRAIDEAAKFRAETTKLNAEAAKFNRDWWVIPITVFGAILAAVVARLPEIMKAFGWSA